MANWRKRAIVTAVIAATVVVWSLTAPLLADGLILDSPVERADAIVVLSGAADYRQRAAGAAALYVQGVAPRVIITDDGQRGGWNDNEKGNPYFVERMSRELIQRGVPTEAIERLDGKVQNTADEAEAIIRIAADRNYSSLLIVTSDFHSRRAFWIFERARERVGSLVHIGLQRAPSDISYPTRYNWWTSVRGWRSVGGEYLKFARYWLFYRS